MYPNEGRQKAFYDPIRSSGKDITVSKNIQGKSKNE